MARWLVVLCVLLSACGGSGALPIVSPNELRGPGDVDLQPRILPYGQLPFQGRRMSFSVIDSATIAVYLAGAGEGVTQLFPYRSTQPTRVGPGEQSLLLRSAMPTAAPEVGGSRFVMLVAAEGPLDLDAVRGMVAGVEGIRVSDHRLTSMRPEDALDQVLLRIVSEQSGPWAAHVFEYVLRGTE